MIKRLQLFIYFLFLISHHAVFAISTNKIDSLKSTINQEQNDSIKIIRLLQLGDIYEHSVPDSALYYYTIALNKSKEIKKADLIARCQNYIGIVYTSLSEYEKAISFFKSSIKINQKLKDDIGTANCYNNIGRIKKDQGKYEQAINNYIRSIKIYDKINYKIGMAYSYGNIGNIHTEQNNEEKAAEYYTKALKLFEELDNKRGMSYCYNNLGITHKNQKKFDKSINYYKKSLELKKNANDQEGIATTLSNIGYVYQLKKDYKNAFEYYNKSLEIDTKLGLKNDIAIDYTDIASIQILLFDSVAEGKTAKQKYLNKAVKYAHKSLKIAEEISSMPTENTAANILMKAYEKKGDYKNALKYSKLYISTKDSLFSNEKTKVLAEMENMFELEKTKLKFEKLEKQKQLDKKIIEAQKAENFTQLIIIVSAIISFVIVLFFSLIILRTLKQKRLANKNLLQKTKEIINKNEELNQQSDELKTLNENLTFQNNQITTQKNEIERIHHQLSESIDYATRLQETILPTPKILEKYLADFFIFFKPKDKVSGDFYWWTKVNNYTIIAAADCTGHGVPGAFMSMLGISFLDEIINKENILNPSEILNTLRTEIIRTLKQKNRNQDNNILGIKDGMDMSIITINHETNLVQFSGANNPLYIITERTLQGIETPEELVDNSTKLLYEIKPNKMPISIYYKMDNFTTHNIQLEKGDQIYMFSDGYADQFGGEKGKKFKSKSFKKILLKNADKKMPEQKKILNKEFIRWKGDFEQIDDVVVLGIKI